MGNTFFSPPHPYLILACYNRGYHTMRPLARAGLLGVLAALCLGLARAYTFPPLCLCDTDRTHSPYRLQFSGSLATDTGSVTCFTVYTVPCNPDIHCCNQDMNKIEFDIGA